MKRFPILLMFLLFCSLSIFAHDVQINVQFSSPSVIVRSSYSGTEAMSYAPVLIYSPDNSKTEYQNGRSDAAGVFAFVPDKAGDWRFVIDDEMGHKEEKSIAVTAEFMKGAADRSEQTGVAVYWKALIGISLIIGFTGIFYWIKAEKGLKTGKKK